MSLQQNTGTMAQTAVRLHTGNFIFAVSRKVFSVLAQLDADRQTLRIVAVRRQTDAEIAALPASIRRDIAWSPDPNHNDN